jgi:hypothetical protein
MAAFPLGVTSAFCATLYMSAWQFDPCVKYRSGVEFRPELLAETS